MFLKNHFNTAFAITVDMGAQLSCTKSQERFLTSPVRLSFFTTFPFSRLLSPFLPYLGSSTYPHKVITAFFICHVPIYYFVGISIFFSSPASRQWQVLCIMALSSYSSLLSLPSTLRYLLTSRKLFSFMLKSDLLRFSFYVLLEIHLYLFGFLFPNLAVDWTTFLNMLNSN